MALMGGKKSKVSDEIPSASMADIAFLLLIFFLVTTVFPKDSGLDMLLPQEGEEQEVSQKNILHLLIQENGIVMVKRGESTAEEAVPPAEVEGIWRQEVAANPNMIAAVKTHPDAQYRYMIDVLDALKAAGSDKISLQLLEP